MLIGLTGGAGCGKSTVMGIFASLGWRCVDADALCHEAYADPDCQLPALFKARWGAEVLDAAGRPDRRAIAGIVFKDAAELEWLESAVHPEILRRARARCELFKGEDFIFDAPLLFEAGWQSLFKKVICVWCDPAVQRSRLLARGWDDGEIARRLGRQMPQDRKLELSDYGIVNSSSLEILELQCSAVSNLIKA